MLAQTTTHRIEAGMDRPMSPASTTSLNPHARAWGGAILAAREQMSAQELHAQEVAGMAPPPPPAGTAPPPPPAGMAPPQPQAGHSMPPPTRKETIEAGETPRKTGAAIRRDKRNRKAARELEAAVSAQKAEVEALRKQQAMAGYSQPPPGYGQPPAGYGHPPPGVPPAPYPYPYMPGMPPAGYGHPPPGYGHPPPNPHPPPR